METTRLSSKGQLVLPKAIREADHWGEGTEFSVERVAEVKIPTLVLDGGASFPFMHVTAEALVDHLSNPQHRTLEGQRHDVSAEVLAPVLAEFFSA